MPHLFGERVRLRAAEKEDITNFLRWVNDPEVTENLTMVSPMSCYEEENWYESMPVSMVRNWTRTLSTGISFYRGLCNIKNKKMKTNFDTVFHKTNMALHINC